MKPHPFAMAAVLATLAVGLVGGAPAQGLADTAKVTGRATINGEPVRGVEVALEPATTRESRASETARTNNDGFFTFTKVPVRSSASSGEWILLVDGAKYGALATYFGDTVRRGDATRLSLNPGSTTSADVVLVAGAGVKGRVVDQDGRPLAGVSVSAAQEGEWLRPNDRTDAQGRYRHLGLSGSELELSTWSNGMQARAVVSPTPGETITVPDLVLEPPPAPDPPGTITAKVKRLKEGDEVRLFDTKTRETQYLVRARTKGTLKIAEEVPPGTYRLVISGTNTASRAFTVRPGKKTKVGAFKGPKKRTSLSGTIKRSDGTPLAQGRVRVYDKYGTLVSKLPNGDAARVRDGKYTVKGLVKGRYTIQARGPKKAAPRTTKHFKVSAGKKAKKSFKLKKTATVSGRVTHGAQPVRGVEIGYVVLNESTCTDGDVWTKYTSERDCIDEIVTGPITDEHGRFTFKNVPLGKRVLFADDPSFGGYKTAESVVKVKKTGTTWNVGVSKP